MDSSERKQFTIALHALAELHGRKITATGMSMYFRALERYPWEEIRKAMDAHVCDSKEGKFFPLPGHIIGKISETNKRQSADEIWASLPLSEQDSVYWTNETKQAFFQAALPLIELGDMMAARMAFRAAYDRICEENKMHSIQYEFSPGWNEAGRETCLQKAIDRGLLTRPEAQRLLPTFEQPANDQLLSIADSLSMNAISKAKKPK